MTPAEERAWNESIQRAYQLAFATPDGKQVLADLIAYCYGRRSTFDENDRRHAFNEGRRDVLMRISEFTNLSLEEIYHLRTSPPRRTAPQPGDD